MDEIPEYWKPQFGLSHSERSFQDTDTHKESDNQNEEEHRVQEPLKSDEMSGQESDEHYEDEEPPRHESESPSSPKTVTEESESDQPNILTSKPSEKEAEEDDEDGIVPPLATPDDELEKESSEETSEEEGVVASSVVAPVDKIKVQEKMVGDRKTHSPVYAKEEVIDPEGSSIAADDRSESDPERSSSSIDVAKDPVDVDVCSERPPSHQDAEKNARIKKERDQCRISEANPHEDVPYKVDRVDVKQLDKDVEAAESYFPSNHWCNPSHMSAFIEGKRCDALAAIPEGSCEEGESLLWQSLPVPSAEVYCIASPRRENIQESPHSLSSHPDPQATQSFWGESPSQLDPRLSSYISGSLGVDGQKRLDSLEQVLALCSKLYVRGRWHELGHVLNQTARQCLSQVRHDAWSWMTISRRVYCREMKRQILRRHF